MLIWDAFIFSDLDKVKIISKKWQEDYNENHPHGSLRGMSPRQHTRLYQEGFYDNQIMNNLYTTILSEKG